MLRLERVSKEFGDVTALRDCSFEVAPGKLVGFLGPNGAGKTTAMRSVFGLVTPDAGRVTWREQPITQRTRLRFGYMPEERGLYPRMPVRAQVIYFGRLHGMDAAQAAVSADRWLDRLGLSDRGEAKVEELSHGNQQRAQLAVALAHEPELLVLDEPFSGLDPIAAETMAVILAEIAGAGAAVVFSSHQLDMVEDLCRDVVIINAGNVVAAGDVQELRAAMPHRYLEVATGSTDLSWVDRLPGARPIEKTPDRIRLLIEDPNIDIAALAEVVQQAGPVREFVFAPPSLSEVFREAVEP
jgi:ABC-2 type transport system ATP-binding protein